MSNPALQLGNYRTSKDYRRLANLAKQCSVICIVDYNIRPDGDMVFRDVASTQYRRYDDEAAEIFQISARGSCYAYAFSEDEFIKQCERMNVEFIVPGSAVQGDGKP